MKTLHLHGFLKERYGESFTLDVATPAEAVHALCAQLPGFRKDVEDHNWHILRGALEDKDDVGEDGLTVTLGAQRDVHLMPALSGAKDGGLFQTIVGAVLVAVGIFTGQTWAISLGIGMAVGGIIQMTTKVPSANIAQQESVDQRPSFLFNGPTNTSSQGLAVPRGYGRVVVGSIVVSAALYAEETAV